MFRDKGCHVLVLAAGDGRRMGVPKALMSTGAQPWWKVQADRLDALGLDATWIVSQRVRAVMAADADAPPRMIVASPSAPMFASVLLGLRSLLAAPPDGVFVLPVDTPAPVAGVWHALAEAGGVAVPHLRGTGFQPVNSNATERARHGQDARATGGGHPVYLPWPWVVAMLEGPVAQAPDPEALRLDELIAADARAIPVTDASVVCNLNTLDDLRSYLAAHP